MKEPEIVIPARVIDNGDSAPYLVLQKLPSMTIDLSEWFGKVYWPDPEDGDPEVVLTPRRPPFVPRDKPPLDNKG